MVVIWLLYLVPWFLRNRGETLDETSVLHVGENMTVVRKGDADSKPVANPDLQVSTPLLRDAARYQIAKEAHTAVVRRRIFLFINLALAATAVVLPFVTTASRLTWIAALVTMLTWLVITRYSVVVVSRRLDARLRLLAAGWDEATSAIDMPSYDPLASTSSATGEDKQSNTRAIELSEPIPMSTNLLDPIPIVQATYVSRPLLRTVRTVDLAPVAPARFMPPLPPATDMHQDHLPLSSTSDEGNDGEGNKRAVNE
jgi:hypothetical protein